MPVTTRLAVLAAAVGLAPFNGTAAAQGAAGHLAIEAVAATSTASRAPDDPFVFLDLTTTVRASSNLDVIVRPYARRLPGGDWDLLFYQAQIRYQPREHIRLDAGIITTPLGLGTFELRQDLNPLVGSPFYYFGPLPPFDRYADRVQLMSGGYPLGAILSVSGSRWDARTGVTDGTPARGRKIFQKNAPTPAAQFILGGGVTPLPGLRIGAGLAAGTYRSSDDTDFYNLPPSAAPIENQHVVVFNLEGEYAFRYTRLSGEWVRDKFSTTTTPAVTRGYYAQVVQTITPRIFAASRLAQVSTPILSAGGRTRAERTVWETTGGYRLTPEITVKVGYEASRRYNVVDWSHAAVGALVWGKRWF